MKNFNNFKILKTYKKSSLAIGNFDGVHKGHQKIFKYAKKNKLGIWRGPFQMPCEWRKKNK